VRLPIGRRRFCLRCMGLTGLDLAFPPDSPTSPLLLLHHIDSINVAQSVNLFVHFFSTAFSFSSRPFLHGYTLLSDPFTCSITWSIRPDAPSTELFPNPSCPLSNLFESYTFFFLPDTAKHLHPYLFPPLILSIISVIICRVSTPHSFDLTNYQTP
jgi:hypothetical protein